MALRPLSLVVILMIAMVGLVMPGFSTALFTSSTTNTGTVSAAADWTPPTVSLQNPGSPVKDTVTLITTASDVESGIAQVTIEFLAANGSWVTVCTSTAAPYSCSWNTKTVADGSYDLRARATDNAGYSTTSASVRTVVANNLLVVLADPGDVVRGTVSLPTTLYNAGTVSYTVRVEYSVAGANSWKTICTNLTSPYTCSWATAGFANQDYDLRSVATAGGTTYTSAVVTDVLVDNAAPLATMVDPGSPLSGTRTFAATVSDAHSGVAQVVLQYAVTGSSSWAALCTITAEPFSCRFDTTRLVDGSYSFRALATDVAGNSTTTAVVTNRLVDNTVSSVSLEDPGALLSGSTTLVANASSTAGVTSVRVQYAPAGTGSWTDICTDTSAPYSCDWATTSVADGAYDLRAMLLDGSGGTTISAVVTNRRVDNSPLRGVDVQAVNGGGTVGKLDNGDLLTLTYSELVSLPTITPGWGGSQLAVSVRLRDGNIFGLGNKGDTLDVLRSGAAVNLGSVNLKEDYVKSGKTATLNATMTAGTVTVNGVERTTVTLRLGTLASGDGLRTVSNLGWMVWTPSGVATDLYGRACSTASVTETGTLDREF